MKPTPDLTWRHRRSLHNRLHLVTSVACLVVVGYSCLRSTGFSPKAVVAGFPHIYRLLGEMAHPDLTVLPRLVAPFVQTIQIAFLGTLLGSGFAIPASLAAARNLGRQRSIYTATRIMLSLIRTIPELLYAAILVVAVGLLSGPFAGVLALGIFAFGIVAKLTSESLEAIDPGPLEALQAAGASWLQMVRAAVIPQVLPTYLSYVLYVFEVNIRASAVLGLVGAGGIGQTLNTALQLFDYPTAATIILVTFVLVVLIDAAGTRLRQSLVSAGDGVVAGSPAVRLACRRLFWGATLLLVTVWSAAGVNVNLGRLMRGVAQVGVIISKMLAPDWGWLSRSLVGMGESVTIAVVGTAVGAVLALPLGFWAAKGPGSARWLAYLHKQILNGVRTFPEIILGILFIAAYGPGALAGVMAIGLHSVGMLGKLLAEIVEVADFRPSEAVVAAGGNRWQVLRLALLPQVLPEFAATVLYRFEINLRASTTLGLVGAGGIGVILLQALQFRRWGVVGVALLVVIVVVTCLDLASSHLRRRMV